MNAVAAIVGANMRRLLNDRGNIFFLIVLPLLIVFALGSAIGSSANDVFVGVVDRDPTPQSTAVRDAVARADGVQVEDVADVDSLRRRIAGRELNAGWIVSRDGEQTVITWVSGIDTSGIAMRGSVDRAVQAVAAGEQVAAALATAARIDRAQAEAVIAGLGPLPLVTVTATTPGTDRADDPSTITAVLAGGELSLFIFLTSLFGAQALLLSRTYGITRRARAAPVTNGQIIVGEAISRYLVAMLQAAIIIVGTIVLFGVDWRSPGAVIALSAAMALVGTGAAMLLGALGRSEQQVAALALLMGLVFAALGGSMQPLEYFPEGMRTVAFAVTPHAWMNDSLWKILVDGAGLGSVLGAVAVLVVTGLVLLVLASRLLMRRSA